MGGSHSPGRLLPIEEHRPGNAHRAAPVPHAALPLPVTKVSTGPSLPVPNPSQTTPNNEHQEFRRSGLLPTRDSNLQRQERQMFLWIFIGMMLLFAGLLVAILVSRI